MINVFDYSDFRKYLTDYYEDKKKANPNFSYQIIANKAGVKNRGFIYNIINGDKVLSKSNIFKVSKALGHNRYEAEFFECLVAFNQAEDMAERKYLFEKMSQVKNTGKTTSEAQILRQDQYEFYSNWYHVMVRSIIGMYDFKDDYKWLSRIVNPHITVTQAKHSVRLLEKLGLISNGKNGAYKICDKSLSTGKDIMSIAFQNFHIACTDLAKRSFTEFPLDSRNMTGLTLGISKKSYFDICEEIQNFQTKIMEIANHDEVADRVYQLNFHFFPTSESAPERKNK